MLEVRDNSNAVMDMLARLSALWQDRAAINKPALNVLDLQFDPQRPDFCEALLPFTHHDAWRAADAEMKSICLTYAWILYNLKTIYIECDIVTPACEDLLKVSPLVGNDRMIFQSAIAEALLDEALHTKMSVSACNYIYCCRHVPLLEFTQFNLLRWKDEALSSCCAEWERRLTRFGMACASETMITDYLKRMSEDTDIQAVCREVTRTHAEDEWSHSSVFSFAAMEIVAGLSKTERAYLQQIIRKTVHMFADNEMGAWSAVFELVGLEGGKDIIADSPGFGEIEVYTDSVNSLLGRIGLAC
jgi:hypothetical protein